MSMSQTRLYLLQQLIAIGACCSLIYSTTYAQTFFGPEPAKIEQKKQAQQPLQPNPTMSPDEFNNAVNATSQEANSNLTQQVQQQLAKHPAPSSSSAPLSTNNIPSAPTGQAPQQSSTKQNTFGFGEEATPATQEQQAQGQVYSGFQDTRANNSNNSNNTSNSSNNRTATPTSGGNASTNWNIKY